MKTIQVDTRSTPTRNNIDHNIFQTMIAGKRLQSLLHSHMDHDYSPQRNEMTKYNKYTRQKRVNKP